MGRAKVSLKVDQVETTVEILMVPTSAQDIPLMVGPVKSYFQSQEWQPSLLEKILEAYLDIVHNYIIRARLSRKIVVFK